MGKPSKLWWAAPALVLFVGVPASYFVLRSTATSRLESRIEGMKRCLMPGTCEIELTTGKKYVYYETKSRLDGKTYELPSAELAPVDCNVYDADDNRLEPPFWQVSGLTYELGDYSGKKLFHVRVPRAGKHRLTCEASGIAEDVAVVVAVGDAVVSMKELDDILMWPIAVFIFGAALGIFVAYKRRDKSVRPPPGPPGPPGNPYAPPPPVAPHGGYMPPGPPPTSTA